MSTRYDYQMELSHEGLNKYRIIKAATEEELEQKASALQAQWATQWAKIVEREKKKKNDEDSDASAKEATQQAEALQTALDNILLNSLHPTMLVANDLKDFSTFPKRSPQKPSPVNIPDAPTRSDEKYNPVPPFFTKLFKKRLEEFEAIHTAEFEQDLQKWENEKSSIEKYNESKLSAYNQELAAWEKERNEFKQKQADENNKIDLLFEQYTAGDSSAIERYFQLMLERIEMPFDYDRSVELEYHIDTKMLLVDLSLPVIDDIPKLKSVSYIKSRKEFKESYYSDSYLKKKYDNVLYQIVLQTLNYIFSAASDVKRIDTVVINGRISTTDKATGKHIEPCILSVSITRDNFADLNLAALDPKAWFRSAKGISAASLANVAAVAPIIAMSREDKRFIDGYAVADTLETGINLATIDWQDFENLIREIFEKEFNVNGGEVKITQASRDGGVDAVAFDPDPIRGGKIVIQAKRYTNVVGVSAVRDLYGTMINEGATKGILVTTANYGSDAYNFAKGKPLTLMNGANLLSLMEKHGYNARINLKEAKEYFKEENK